MGHEYLPNKLAAQTDSFTGREYHALNRFTIVTRFTEGANLAGNDLLTFF
jgi:hypothetical protein